MICQTSEPCEMMGHVSAVLCNFKNGHYTLEDPQYYTIGLPTRPCAIFSRDYKNDPVKQVSRGFVAFRDFKSVCELAVCSDELEILVVKFDKDWFDTLLESSQLGGRLDGRTHRFDFMVSSLGIDLHKRMQGDLDVDEIEDVGNIFLNRLFLAEHFHDPIRYISDRRMALAIDYIDNNYQKKVRVKDVAYIAGLSEFHFSRLFAQRFGMSSHDFLMRRRLSSAVRLMCETDMSLSEIAVACGFCDQSHLNRWIARETTTTPRRLRGSSVERALALSA